MNTSVKKQRESNLALYRIVVMLMIVAHHYVVNSGLFDLISQSPPSVKSLTMLVFGGWGKTGINCFIMITGWFMSRSEWSYKKLLKLYMQVAFYAFIIYSIFCISGHEKLTPIRALLTLWPVKGLHSNFVGCFMVWYLFIPFLNILLNNLTKSQLGVLALIMLSAYCFLDQIPSFDLEFNYVSWFTALYFVAAYIRNYGLPFKTTHTQWGIASLCFIIIGGVA